MELTSARILELLAKALHESEREAVLGDLAESGETGMRAVSDVCGLVLRREAALFRDGRPWLVFAAITAPFCLFISVLARRISGETAVYFWMYANNLDWRLLGDRGFWYLLPEVSLLTLIRYLTLSCWSWSIGYVVGSLSRKFFRSSTLLFVVMLLFGEIVGAPHYFNFYRQYLHQVLHLPFPPNQSDPVSTLAFYRVLFPMLLQVAFVLAPGIWGMREAARERSVTPLLRGALWVAAITTLLTIVMQEPGFGILLKTYKRPWLWQGWEVRSLHYVAYWPLIYLVAAEFRRRWAARTALVTE